MDEPGTDHAVRISRFIDVMAVRRSELPASGARPGVGERRHVRVIDMSPSPDLQLIFRKDHGLIDVETQYAYVRYLGEPAAPGDGVGGQRIVVAGQGDDGGSIVAPDFRRAFE